MRRREKLSVVGLGALAAIGAFSALPAPGQAQDKSPDRAAQMFGKRCASCHTVPDATVKTDKAWLGQILETA